MTKDELKTLTNQVVDLSREIGSWMKMQRTHEDSAELKTPNNLVTFVDKESERRFVDGLSALLPEAGYVAEEGTGEKKEGGYNWVIDPLDGTVNYLYGLPGWNVSIAAKDSEGVLVGVVYAPSINGFWSAGRGGDATYNGEKIKCNDPVTLDKALLSTGFAYDLDLRSTQGNVISNLLPRIRDLRRNGAAAVDLCYVAMGSLDGYFEASLSEWDHAAGGLIATQAGAVISGRAGGPANKELVVCAGPALHAQLLPLI